MLLPILIASQNVQRQCRQSTRRFNHAKDKRQNGPRCSQEFFEKVCDAEFQKFIRGNKAKLEDVEGNIVVVRQKESERI